MENDLEKYQIFIGNEWHDSATEETFESYNPYTGEPWAKIPKCDARMSTPPWMRRMTRSIPGPGGRCRRRSAAP